METMTRSEWCQTHQQSNRIQITSMVTIKQPLVTTKLLFSQLKCMRACLLTRIRSTMHRPLDDQKFKRCFNAWHHFWMSMSHQEVPSWARSSSDAWRFSFPTIQTLRNQTYDYEPFSYQSFSFSFPCLWQPMNGSLILRTRNGSLECCLASIMIAKRALPSTAASHVMFCSELNSHYCPSIENCKALCGSCCMDTYRVGCGWATCYVDSVSHARSGRRFFNSSVAVGEWMRRPVWLQLSWPTTLLRCCWLLS